MEKEMTALVRNHYKAIRVFHESCFATQKEYAEDLRNNGFKVLKIWDGNQDEGTAMTWLFAHKLLSC